jgi:protein-disulfide isomerase
MRDKQASDGPSLTGALFGMVLTFFGGYFLGSFNSGGKRSVDPIGEAATAKRSPLPVGSSPSLGSPDALVTVVEFADFQCPACSRIVHLEKQLRADFSDKVRLVFKQFPLPASIHPAALPAAKASLAAHSQGHFWEYHDRLFANQGNLSEQQLVHHAEVLGLDLPRFRAALADPSLEKAVIEDKELGKRLDVEGTPTLFVNGRQIYGAPSYEELSKIVRQELAHAAQILRRGVPVHRLYDEVTGVGAVSKSGPPSGEVLTHTGTK